LFWVVFSLSALVIENEKALVFYKSLKIPFSVILLVGFSYLSREKKEINISPESYFFAMLSFVSVLPTLCLFVGFIKLVVFPSTSSSFPSFFVAIIVSILGLYSFFAGAGLGEMIFSDKKEGSLINESKPTQSFYEVGRNSADKTPN